MAKYTVSTVLRLAKALEAHIRSDKFAKVPSVLSVSRKNRPDYIVSEPSSSPVIVSHKAVEDALAEKRSVFVKEIKERTALASALLSLRSSIAAFNQTSGLNDLMAERVYLDNVIRVLTSSSLSDETDTVAQSSEQIKELFEPRENEYGHLTNHVDISFADKELVDFVKTSLLENKKKHRHVSDSMAHLNATGTIDVSDEIMSLLNSVGIV